MIRLDNLKVGPQLCRITVEKAKTARVFYSLNGGGQLNASQLSSRTLIEQFFTTMVSNKLEFHSCILQRCKIFTQDAVFLFYIC